MGALELPCTAASDRSLIDLVVFKWLMAGFGWWVDVQRLQRDSIYARQCAQRGLATDCFLLRQKSAELPRVLGRSREQPRRAHRATNFGA